MPRKLKPAMHSEVFDVREAVHHLKRARDLMKRVGCPQSVKRIRLALTSAKGAERHVSRRHSKFLEQRQDGQ